MKLVDVTDSKSVDGAIVWVRIPPPAPVWNIISSLGFFYGSFLRFILFSMQSPLFPKKPFDSLTINKTQRHTDIRRYAPHTLI